MSDDKTKPRRPQRRKPPNGYLLMWAGLAAFSMGYLAVAIANPSLLAGLLPISSKHAEQAAQASSGSELAAHVTRLDGWIRDLSQDVSATKTSLEAQAARTTDLEHRLASVESRTATAAERPAVPPMAEASPPPPAHVATAAENGASGRRGNSEHAKSEPKQHVASAPAPSKTAHKDRFEEAITAAIEPAKKRPPVRIINSAPPSPITTGSLPAKRAAPPPFQPPKVTRTEGPPTAIEIGRADSLDALRSRWGELAGRNSAVLKRLAPRYKITADASGSPFKLLAGPFSGTAEALRACSALKARGVACSVGDYTGNAL
ncbi:MAG: hypothetical protein AB7O43_02445 [Hyphomicrobiaceae bacterium]